MDKNLSIPRSRSTSRMGRRQAFGDIHEGAGLAQKDIEHLRQVYISACLTGLHGRPNILQSQSYEADSETPRQLHRSSRHRSVPAVLNEFSMDSRLIQFLENNGHKTGSKAGIMITFPDPDDNNTIQENNETNFIDMLTKQLVEASIQNNSSDEKHINDTEPKTTQRRLHNADVVNSQRFRERRFALGNIMDTIDVRKMRKQLSVPAGLGTQSFFQLTVSEVPQSTTTIANAPLAY